MKLEFIDIGKIENSAVNMRASRKAPDVSDILPTVRKRRIIVPVVLRPGEAAATVPAECLYHARRRRHRRGPCQGRRRARHARRTRALRA